MIIFKIDIRFVIEGANYFMNIVVVGGGKVGEILCKELSTEESYDLTLIEKNERVLDKLISKFDIQGICGSGISIDILKEAGVEHSDFFIAVSQKDETNIIACIMAKKLGAKYTIARVREREYSAHMDFVRDSLGISQIINPDFEASYSIYRMVKYAYATNIENFMNNKVSMVGVFVEENSAIANMYLKDFRKKFDVIVCIIQRGIDVFIPNGESLILPDDIIHVTGTSNNMQKFYSSVGFLREKPLKSALIVGGGKLSSYLIPLLKRLMTDIKVIEIKYDIAKKLSEEYNDVSIINGDGTDQDFLDEMTVGTYDTCITLTGIDEENALISMYASKKGVRKTITKMNRLSILKVINVEQIKSIITPKRIIADKIIRSVRSRYNASGSNVEQLYTLANHEVEALQFKISGNSKAVDIPLESLNIKPNTVIAFILRQGEVFFPTGKDVLMKDDKVLVVTKNSDFTDIDDMLL